MANFSADRMTLLLDLLQPKRKTRILDVGANPINASPYQNLIDMGACEVWGFEPQPDAFAALQKSASPLEHYLPYAIGDGKDASLYVCDSEGFTSLLKPSAATIDYLNYFRRHMTVVDTIELTTKRLDDLDELPKIDFLKIDVQGSEVTVFEGGVETLSEAVAIITEVAFIPLYENQPLYHHQALQLESMGFRLSKFLFLKARHLRTLFSGRLAPKENKNQLIDGDAVFVRDFSDSRAMTDEQLKHLAICADGILESYDLALKCISELADRGHFDTAQAEPYAQCLPTLK